MEAPEPMQPLPRRAPNFITIYGPFERERGKSPFVAWDFRFIGKRIPLRLASKSLGFPSASLSGYKRQKRIRNVSQKLKRARKGKKREKGPPEVSTVLPLLGDPTLVPARTLEEYVTKSKLNSPLSDLEMKCSMGGCHFSCSKLSSSLFFLSCSTNLMFLALAPTALILLFFLALTWMQNATVQKGLSIMPPFF